MSDLPGREHGGLDALLAPHRAHLLVLGGWGGLALESRYPGILVPRQLACPQAVFDYESGKKIFLGLQDCRQACF